MNIASPGPLAAQPVDQDDPSRHWRDVMRRIADSARAADRAPADVTLVAVSKQQPWANVAPILEAGQRVFGENRVQEAQGRWSALRAGELGQALADVVQAQGRSPRLYVQVNTGEEPQKAGIAPTDADGFIARLRREFGFEPEGLMCIPPVGEAAGPHFALLAKIAARNGLARLSMGMSADFETAIRFGATSVRVGSAVFGARA
jgi:uncharacterized pyridoxal phosphate-containing UPF0001 family protein